jgi:hypothetical protein
MLAVRDLRGSQTPWRVIGIAVFVVAAVLLVSMGGAIVAAPITVPLMFIAARRHPTRSFRVAGAVISSLTIAEVAWAITYLAVEDRTPWIWLLPLIAAIATLAAFAAESESKRRALPAAASR